MGVAVDNDFVRFGSKSYAINKITSVEVRQKKSENWGCAVALLCFATLAITLFAIAMPPLLILAIGSGFLAYKAWQRAKRVTYQLFLITTASEAQAYESFSSEDVASLREQVEEAMVSHSRSNHPDA